MKRTFTAALTALTLLAATTTAFAQDTPTPEVGQDDAPREVVAKVTEYGFENDNITGSFDNPLGSVHTGETHAKLKNLINVRTSFHDELIKSVDAL